MIQIPTVKTSTLPQPGPNSSASASSEHGFADCYSLKETWQDDPNVDVHGFLMQLFGEFYTPNGMLVAAHLRNAIEGIVKVGKGITKENKQAMECFKNLFVFPYRCDEISRCANLPIMQSLKGLYGDKIIASGVEEMKGGINNILLMAISRKVLIPQGYWGAFKDGSPNMSPISHGPYYVIYKVNGLSEKGPQAYPNNPSFDEIEHILVPFDEIKDALISHLQKVLDAGLLSDTDYNHFISKVKTYHAFKAYLDEHLALDIKDEKMTHQAQLNSLKELKTNAPIKPLLFNFLPCNKQQTNSLGIEIPKGISIDKRTKPTKRVRAHADVDEPRIEKPTKKVKPSSISGD